MRQQRGYAGNRCGTVLKYSSCGDGLFAVEETLSLSGLAGSFDRLAELHMSQIELSRRTGIATSTISDWRKKKINPQADKLVAICKALDAIWFFL